MHKLLTVFILSALFASMWPTPAAAAPSTAAAIAPLAAGTGSWTSLGTPPLNGDVHDIEIINGDLYIAGDFTDAGGDSNADGIAKLENGNWVALGSGLGVGALVRTIAYDGTYIYIGGSFSNVGGDPNANSIAKFDGSVWSSLNGATTGLNNHVHDIEINSGNLYAGGDFINAGGIAAASYIAMFNGSTWSALGTGTGATVRDIEFAGGSVYAAGDFPAAGGDVNANYISRFDGSSWLPLNSASTALSLTVHDMEFSSGALYIGGEFTDAGTLSPGPDYVAKLQSGTWGWLGAGLNGDVYKVAMIDGVLYAGGIFSNAGGDPDGDHVAKFENGVWSSLGGPGSGLNNPALDFALHDGVLYAAGYFSNAGGDPDADGIAMFIPSSPPQTPTTPTQFVSTPIGTTGNTSLTLGRILVSVPAVAIPAGQTGCLLQIEELNDGSKMFGFTLDDVVFDVTIRCDSGELSAFAAPLTVCIRPLDGVTNKRVYHRHNGADFAALGSEASLAGYVCGQTRLLSLFTLGQLALPATGFAPGAVTRLAEQPAALAYAASDLVLSIPKLGVELNIVGVPQGVNGWDVSWLSSSQAGYLYGTSFPTWEGNSVLTAHVWNADNRPGPFHDLKDLQHGDRFTITAYGYSYVYEVRSNQLVLPSSLTALGDSPYNLITLITCESFDAVSGNYRYRRAVQAVLLEIN
ncbi:MAG: sortase [Anaerolineales bacterium]|nr:MAG: sortase [Anaerolineales bacterium]